MQCNVKKIKHVRTIYISLSLSLSLSHRCCHHSSQCQTLELSAPCRPSKASCRPALASKCLSTSRSCRPFARLRTMRHTASGSARPCSLNPTATAPAVAKGASVKWRRRGDCNNTVQHRKWSNVFVVRWGRHWRGLRVSYGPRHSPKFGSDASATYLCV